MPNKGLLVAVVGLGKIGLPLAVQYAQHGRAVIGCDIDPQVVTMINAGRSHIQEEPELANALPMLVQRGLLSATTNTTEAVRQADVIVVIVPVIVDVEAQPNFTAIDAATTAIGAGLRPGTLVIYETTVPVGTTTVRFARLLEENSHLKAGRDFLLAYSPERVSSGSLFRDLRIYPKIIGGIDKQSTDAAVAFYRSVLDAQIIEMASCNDAEFVKLIETTYRDVNIALANEFARFADARGLDVTAAIVAANTQPYSHIHTPGVGVGGHCIPVYPHFLLAGLADIPSSSLERPMLNLPQIARGINDSMAEYAVSRLEMALGSLINRPILILGAAYRGNVRETAFTSAKHLQDALVCRKARAYIDDPLFTTDELHAMGYTPLTPEVECQVEAIILQANHQMYQSLDFGRFPNCRAVLDGRLAWRRCQIEAQGLQYLAIGDGHGRHGGPREEPGGAHALSREEESICE